MGRTPAQAALDEVIRLGLAPALKADGYRKDGRIFRRERERCVQVVSVQSSRSSTAEEVRFTINLGVYFPEVQTVMESGYGPGPRGPTDPDCHVRQRIGFLMPEPRDRWWTVRPASWIRALDGKSAARTAEEVRDALERARPWLDRMADLREARDAADRSGSAHAAAAMSLVLGDEPAARLIAERAAREAPRAVLLLAWFRDHGLLPR